ncbi:ATP-binding cassette domain-containing protein [Luedemannella flava]
MEFAGVSVAFGGTQALAGVDLTVHRGEMVALVGPSGCGKSTLLRLAAGFQGPTAGTVSVTGDSLGYVFQDATLMPWRSVQRNVELPDSSRACPRPSAAGSPRTPSRGSA